MSQPAGQPTPSQPAAAETTPAAPRIAPASGANLNISPKRVTFGKPLSQRQAISFTLAENAADIEASRQLSQEPRPFLPVADRHRPGEVLDVLLAGRQLVERERMVVDGSSHNAI